MKTTKLLLLIAIAALVVYSCSSERDEELKTNPVQSKLDLKKIKTSNKTGETSKPGDSIQNETQIAFPGGSDPITPTDPNDTEIVHPGDVKPPKP